MRWLMLSRMRALVDPATAIGTGHAAWRSRPVRGSPLVDYDLHESGFRAKDLEETTVRVAAQEHPESVVDAQHPNGARCVCLVHLLPQDRRFSSVQRTVHPSRRTVRHAPICGWVPSRNGRFAKSDGQGAAVMCGSDSLASTDDQWEKSLQDPYLAPPSLSLE